MMKRAWHAAMASWIKSAEILITADAIASENNRLGANQ